MPNTSTSTARHRRTPSVPLKVRASSISSLSSRPIFSESTLLSPSNTDIPPAIPATSPLSSATSVPALPSKSSEKYGFVVYVGSLVAWWIYLFWAFVPDRYLQALGLEWYPSREWAILIPSWIMVAVIFVYVAYFALNLYNTPALDDLCTMFDTQGHILPSAKVEEDGKTRYPAYSILVNEGHGEDYIPPLYDLPPGIINRALFGDG